MNGEREKKEAIVPQCTNETFRDWSDQDFSAVLDFKTNGMRPNLKQPESECDKNARSETFWIELQIFSRPACSFCQRNACALGNPSWSRIRQTTVSAMSLTFFGVL